MSSRKIKPPLSEAQIIQFPSGRKPRVKKPQPIIERPDLFDDDINLTDYLVTNYDATCVVRIRCNQPEHELHRGDLIVVDRSETPRPGELVTYEEGEGELTIEQYRPRPLSIGESPAPVFGVVMHRIHSYRKES
jgi:SOS-response transcriptional repressor LexA